MKLFVIEGIDGAGKSTQIKLLKDYFSAIGMECEYLHFPRVDAPFFGELISRFLRGEFGSLSEVNPWIVAMLYAGDRKDSAAMITDWLNNNKIVLLDRYTYSNIAYQCAKLSDAYEQERLMKWILDLEFNHFGIPEPGLNIFLDVPFIFTENKLKSSRTGDDRVYLNGTHDIHESSLAFQKSVREMYLRVSALDKRLCVINCSDTEGNMFHAGKISELILNEITKRNLL
jgi:dTMP kinase